MEQIPIYFYFIFFQMTFLIHEMNIQLFSFDWGELYRGFHNFEPPLTLLNLDFAEPWFKILLTQCSVLVTDFSYNFYIHIHEWAWRSSLHTDLSATVTCGVLFYHVLGDSLCVGFLCSLNVLNYLPEKPSGPGDYRMMHFQLLLWLLACLEFLSLLE